MSTIKAAQWGLYGGKKIISGDRVSEMGNKSKRKWFPNIQTNTFYSEILKKKLTFSVTTQVLRMVDKMGGIDNYLLKSDPKKLDSELGLQWKSILENYSKTPNNNITNHSNSSS